MQLISTLSIYTDKKKLAFFPPDLLSSVIAAMVLMVHYYVVVHCVQGCVWAIVLHGEIAFCQDCHRKLLPEILTAEI